MNHYQLRNYIIARIQREEKKKSQDFMNHDQNVTLNRNGIWNIYNLLVNHDQNVTVNRNEICTMSSGES